MNSKIIKIKIFTTWTDCNTIFNTVINEYDWESDSKYGVDYIFTKDNDFTHSILMNFAMPNISINKENVIGLAQEPAIHFKFEGRNSKDKFINYCKNNVKKYFIGATKPLKIISTVPFIEKMSYQLPHISYKIVNKYIENFPTKNKIINYVYSSKNSGNPSQLYHYRHELGSNILKCNLHVDIYGSGTNTLKKNFPNKENIKYEFDWKDVHKIYEEYKFCIVVENTREPEYISEKIFIPLFCGCIPIYLGCTNINNYFKDYVIHLSGNIKEDVKLIETIINNPDKYYKKINIKDIKEKVHLKNIIHQEFL
jgi:hypothetical protein